MLNRLVTPERPGRPDPALSREAASKVAYLVNCYPQTSHTFIRREIAALEAGGLEVARFSIRAPDGGGLVDPADVLEESRTRVVLRVGVSGLLVAAIRAMIAGPLGFARAAAAAVGLGLRSERGVGVNLIYLAEACVLKGWLDACGAGHLHAHFGTNPAAVARLCRALGGPPYSFTVHGPEEFDAPRALSLREKVRHASAVIAVSEFTRSQLFRWADPADWPRIHVVRCGVDSAFLGATPLSPPPAARHLVCVGRLAEQKGPFVLLQAAARLRDLGVEFELTLVGDGPLRGAVERESARLGLGGRVRVAGWMGGDGVRGAILGARALVLPSFAEGLPVVLMEALAVGRPVIATYVAGIPELVSPGVSGWLVPAGSVDDLADALRDALDAPAERLAEMGRAGAARVAERHDAGIEAARLAAVVAGVRLASAGVTPLRATTRGERRDESLRDRTACQAVESPGSPGVF